MLNELLEIKLLCDQPALSDLRAEIDALGGMLICHGCEDVEALITALLISEQEEEAWPLCGECVRRLPLAGAMV